MTKREICERLIHTRDIMASLAKIVAEDRLPFNLDEVGKCGDFLRSLLLDLAAPEEEPKPETPEAEEKHPGFIVKAGGDGVPGETDVCLKCGGPVFCVVGEYYRCDKCGETFPWPKGEQGVKEYPAPTTSNFSPRRARSGTDKEV